MTEVQSIPQPNHTLSEESHTIPLQRTDYGSHIDPTMVGWLKPTSKDTPVEEIRDRYLRDGYVWIKGIIPRDEVFDIREYYFSNIAPTGMLEPSSNPRDGIFNHKLDPIIHQGLGATPEKSHESLLDAIHASPEYHQFLAHPKLREWVRRLTGWEKEVILKRGLIRHNVPGSKCPSGIHYDQLFLRGGDPVFVSAWIPLGDCPANGGGLMYLEKSCPLGEQIENRYRERQEQDDMPPEERVNAFNVHMGELGHLSHDAENWAKGDGQGKTWLVANYEAGDVVFHSPWMIHASSRNEDAEGRIRLSSDVRFYDEKDRLDPRWTRYFFYGDGI